MSFVVGNHRVFKISLSTMKCESLLELIYLEFTWMCIKFECVPSVY
jgi:hypothetical protein